MTNQSSHPLDDIARSILPQRRCGRSARPERRSLRCGLPTPPASHDVRSGGGRVTEAGINRANIDHGGIMTAKPTLPGFHVADVPRQTPHRYQVRIEFFVPGIAKPGGSKRAIPLMRNGRPILRANGTPIVNVVDDSKNLDWKRSVAVFAREVFHDDPLEGPLKVQCEFIVQRPSGRNADLVKDSAPEYPTTKPDATKLFRSTEDALTGILWRDDAQIVLQVISKKYGAQPGARIVIARA